MTTYYHFRRSHRNPGDVINPSMRSILDLYQHGPNSNPWRLATELALEERRLVLAPNAVSRIESNFVFMAEQDALTQVFRMTGCKHLFEVEFVDPDAPTFTADFDLVSKLLTSDNALFLPKVKAIAEPYWKGVVVGTPELLTTSPLRVLRTARTFA